MRVPKGSLRLVNGEVHVAAQGAFVHLAVAHARVGDHRTKLLQIGHRLLRRADVRLGDDLDQRHAAAVAVDQRAMLGIVYQLARVLLDVDAGNADALFPVRSLDRQVTAHA